MASEGGDGPEAQAATLSEVLNMDWRDNAIKIVVLVTGAPLHGIGEDKDSFPEGSPDRELLGSVLAGIITNFTFIRT